MTNNNFNTNNPIVIIFNQYIIFIKILYQLVLILFIKQDYSMFMNI